MEMLVKIAQTRNVPHVRICNESTESQMNQRQKDEWKLHATQLLLVGADTRNTSRPARREGRTGSGRPRGALSLSPPSLGGSRARMTHFGHTYP